MAIIVMVSKFLLHWISTEFLGKNYGYSFSIFRGQTQHSVTESGLFLVSYT